MPRGRPKKPAILKHLEGPKRGHGEPIDAIIEFLGAPFTPEHLSDDARGCIEVIRQSVPPKVFSCLDSFLLASFGIAWAAHKEATIRLFGGTEEWIYETENGRKVKNPWFDLLVNTTHMMVSAGTALCITPATRSKLAAVLQGPQKPQDSLEILFGRSASSNSSSNSVSPPVMDKVNN